MGDERRPEWVRTLDEVGDAVRGCLSALDGYEARFGGLLAEECHPRPVAPSADPPPDAGERLAAAHAEAEAVERMLVAGEENWRRWQDTFAVWRRTIEQPSI